LDKFQSLAKTASGALPITKAIVGCGCIMCDESDGSNQLQL
jgi:hypothetical protein